MSNNYQSRYNINTFIAAAIIMGVLIIILLLYFFAKLVYEDQRRLKFLKDFKQTNYEIYNSDMSNKEKKDYFASSQFLDKWNKEKKNLINPGEIIYKITSADERMFEERRETLTDEERKVEMLKHTPRSQQWFDYFFGKKMEFD